MANDESESELDRALARPDAAKLIRQIDTYVEHMQSGEQGWPEEISDDLGEVLQSGQDDPDKALAYVVIAAARTDDDSFLGFMGAGPLEDALESPNRQFLERVVAEARRSKRFRWILSVPYRVAISDDAWHAIKDLATYDTRIKRLPPRDA
jgi:hypothetical protein